MKTKKMILTKADKRSMKYFLKKLNSFLDTKEFEIGKFGQTLKRFEKRFDFKIGIIDFKYYGEQRLMKVRKKMLKQERIQNYGYLRNLSKLERICLNHIELRKLFNFEKSTFLYEENYLLFCQCGTYRNDCEILLWLLLDERFVELKIRV
jgi:hypothetical protein